MTQLCLEDGFQHNIDRALKRYMADFDTADEAIENFDQADHYDQFLTYLGEQAENYSDLREDMGRLRDAK